eukprot:5877223-Alexandrium_andersonii.AAC.1
MPIHLRTTPKSISSAHRRYILWESWGAAATPNWKRSKAARNRSQLITTCLRCLLSLGCLPLGGRVIPTGSALCAKMPFTA